MQTAGTELKFLKKILFIYFSRGEGREKERDTHINLWFPHAHPLTVDLACNPGTCPLLGMELATFWFTGQHLIH